MLLATTALMVSDLFSPASRRGGLQHYRDCFPVSMSLTEKHSRYKLEIPSTLCHSVKIWCSHTHLCLFPIKVEMVPFHILVPAPVLCLNSSTPISSQTAYR